ncbi:MAG: phosphatase PAP2 family protein [Hydrogenothermaceae bacterium]|nr:phosphatase PAP2 family protein [Hydrogenothermaceae bacterium]
MSRDWEVKIEWNVKLFYYINSRRSRILDLFYKRFFYMGKSYSLPVYLLMFWLSGTDHNGYIHLAISLIITGILMPLLKYTFRHKRPFTLLENVHLLEPVSLKSFPSADSAYVFTIFSVSLFYPDTVLSAVLFLISLVIGYGRVYMGAHFPIDVLVGFFCGSISAFTGFYLKELI